MEQKMNYFSVAKTALFTGLLVILSTVVNAQTSTMSSVNSNSVNSINVMSETKRIVQCDADNVAESDLQFKVDTDGQLADSMRLDAQKCVAGLGRQDFYNVPGVLKAFPTRERATDFVIIARDLRRICAEVGMTKEQCASSIQMMYEFPAFESDAEKSAAKKD